MQGEVFGFARRIVALWALAFAFCAPSSARDPSLVDGRGQPRSELPI